MLNLFTSLVDRIKISKKIVHRVSDPTLYKIETEDGNYCGKIFYQDDVIITLELNEPGLKIIKIIKINIKHIRVINVSGKALITEY